MADSSHNESSCVEILRHIHKEMHSEKAGYSMNSFQNMNGSTCILLVVNVDDDKADIFYDAIKDTVNEKLVTEYPQEFPELQPKVQ